MIHVSSCAINNEPAEPAGPCSCGLDLAVDTARKEGIVPLVEWARGHGFLVGEMKAERFFQVHDLPASRLSADATASHLPDAHCMASILGDPDGVYLNDSRETVVAQLKALS